MGVASHSKMRAGPPPLPPTSLCVMCCFLIVWQCGGWGGVGVVCFYTPSLANLVHLCHYCSINFTFQLDGYSFITGDPTDLSPFWTSCPNFVDDICIIVSLLLLLPKLSCTCDTHRTHLVHIQPSKQKWWYGCVVDSADRIIAQVFQEKAGN